MPRSARKTMSPQISQTGAAMAMFLGIFLWLAAGVHAQTCTPSARNPVLRITEAHPETCTPGILTVTGHMDMDAHRISNVADPVDNSDAISKTYLDAALLASTQEEKDHQAVRMKTVSDLTPFATQAGPNGTGHMIVADNDEDINTRNSTFDGVSNIAEGDRVLVDRTAWGAVDPGSGLYIVTQRGNASAPWILTRAPDADTADKLKGGCRVFVTQGTAFADTGWVVSSDMHVLDVSNLEWMQYAGGGGVSAGTGLTMVGSVISVLPDQVLDTLQLTQQTGGSGVLTFEGPNVDGFDTTLGSVAQTAPRVLYLPDASGVLSTGIPNTLGRVRAKSVLNLVGVASSGGPAGIGHTLTSVNLESITIARAAEFDGVGLVLGDRVLIYGTKLDALSDVGVYEVTAVGAAFISSWVLTRATDLDETTEYYAGVSVVIQEGTTEEGRGYVVTTTGSIVVDTTEPVWSPRPCELSAKSSQRKGTAECAMQGGDVTYTGTMTAHEHTVFAGAPGIFITKAGPSDTFMKRALIAASESTAIKDVRFQNFGMLACASTVLWSSATLSPHILNDVALIASKATTWGDSSGGVDQFYTFTNSVGMANVAFTVTGTRVTLDQVAVMASDTFTVVADDGTTADAWANCGAVATTGCTWGDLTDTAGELNGQVFIAGSSLSKARGKLTNLAMLATKSATVGVPGSSFDQVGMLATESCAFDAPLSPALSKDVALIGTENLRLQARIAQNVVFAAVHDTVNGDVDIADGMQLLDMFVGGVEGINWTDTGVLLTRFAHSAIVGSTNPVLFGNHMTIWNALIAACADCGYSTPAGSEGLGSKVFLQTAIIASSSSKVINDQAVLVQHKNILIAACETCVVDVNTGPIASTNQRAFIGGTNLPNTCGDNSLTTNNLCAADVEAATMGMSTGAGTPGQIILSADTAGSFVWGNINNASDLVCTVAPPDAGTTPMQVVVCGNDPASITPTLWPPNTATLQQVSLLGTNDVDMSAFPDINAKRMVLAAVDALDVGGVLQQVMVGASKSCTLRGGNTNTAILASEGSTMGISASLYTETAMVATTNCMVDPPGSTDIHRLAIIGSHNFHAAAYVVHDAVFAGVYDLGTADVEIQTGVQLWQVFVGGTADINWLDADPVNFTKLHHVAVLGCNNPIISGQHMLLEDVLIAASFQSGYTTPAGSQGTGVKVLQQAAIIASSSSLFVNTRVPDVDHTNVFMAACLSCTIDVDAGPVGTNQRAFIGGTNLSNTCGDDSLTTNNLCAADVEAATMGMTTGAGASGQVILSSDTAGSFAWGSINAAQGMQCTPPAVSGGTATRAVACSTGTVTMTSDIDSKFNEVAVMATGSPVTLDPGLSTFSNLLVTASDAITLSNLQIKNVIVAGSTDTSADAVFGDIQFSQGAILASTNPNLGASGGSTTYLNQFAAIATDAALTQNNGITLNNVALVGCATCGFKRTAPVTKTYDQMVIMASFQTYVTNADASGNQARFFMAACKDCTMTGASVNRAIIAAEGAAISAFSDTCGNHALTTNKLCTNGITLSDGADIAVDTTTGTTIGTAASQKLGFWGAVPVVQHSEMAVTGNHTSGLPAAVAVDDQSTFDGGLGGSAYNIHAIVAALKNAGFLAP